MTSVTRRGVLTVLTLGVVSLAATAGAQGPDRWRAEPTSAEIVLEDAFGDALPSFYHEGRWFVLGEPGERYVIRVTNPTSERVEAVVSVDGRDAISGRVADYRAQRGYIVPPYGSVVIDGFRRSLSTVASFRFANPADSYSARMGTPENVGIVGLAVFSERKRKPLPPPVARAPRPSPRYDAAREAPSASGDSAAKRRSADAAPSRSPAKGADARGRASAPRDSVDNLGTEYGETRESSVVEVPFERASSRPARVLTLRYDDVDGLRARGIDVRPRWPVREEPEAFPNSRFAAPPP